MAPVKLAKKSDLTALSTELADQQDQLDNQQATLDVKQNADADLTAIAALTPADDDFIQRKSGVWVNRSVAQVKTDLAISAPDFGKSFSVPMAGAHSSSAPGANLLVYGEIKVLGAATLTGLFYYVGATSNGNVKVALYNSTGNRVAEQTGTIAQGTANNLQQVPFDATVDVTPGRYFAALILSSGTGTRFGGSVSTLPGGSAAQGGFACPSSITVPTVLQSAQPTLVTY